MRGSLVSLLFVTIGVPVIVVACKKTPATTAAQCEELRAGAAASALRVVTSASSPCMTADDCAEIDHLSCDYGCSGYPIATAGRATAEKAMAKIEKEQCKAWKERDCEKIAPLPVASCATPKVACRKNRCEMRYPFDTLSAERCDALVLEADKELATAIEVAVSTCKTDTDCTVVNDQGCFWGCGGRAINVQSLPAYEAARKRVQEGPCAKFNDGDCMTTTPRALPSCMPAKARCLPPKIKKPEADRYSGHCIVEH